MKIKSFGEFINESWEDVNPEVEKKMGGVAIIYDNKILLVHPTNASWQKPTLGIPKGRVEEGEDLKDAALRELEEETGISLDSSQVSDEPLTVDYMKKDGSIDKEMVYFTCNIRDLTEIGMDKDRVKKENLQLEEVDWAGFLSPTDAYPKVSHSQLIILDRHLDNSEMISRMKTEGTD
jgi:ADP-ribose pyrophosphatase YjhB (NUDIX family)